MFLKRAFPALLMSGGDSGGRGVLAGSAVPSAKFLGGVRDVEDEAVDLVETEVSVEPLRPVFCGGLTVTPGERRDCLVDTREDAPGEDSTGRSEGSPLALEAQEIVFWFIWEGNTEACL